MANNSSTCDLGETGQMLVINLPIIAYRVIAPIYFGVGVITRGICLFAFYKEYKKETAYVYQILSTVSDMFEVIAVSLANLLFNNLSGFRLSGPEWFKQIYVLMSLAAVSPTIKQCFITSSLLLAVAMAADRLFATAKPFVYKKINHKRHQTMAAIFCFVIGFSTSAFDVGRYTVRQSGEKFVMAANEAYLASNIAFGFAILRNAVLFIGDIALILCNIGMVYFYHANSAKVTALANTQKSSSKVKSAEKTLLLLTVCQSFFMSVDLTMLDVYYTLAYSIPTFSGCFGKILAPICDTTLFIAGIIEFFALLVVSKQFRKTVLSYLPCKTNQTNVTAMSKNTGSMRRESHNVDR